MVVRTTSSPNHPQHHCLLLLFLLLLLVTFSLCYSFCLSKTTPLTYSCPCVFSLNESPSFCLMKNKAFLRLHTSSKTERPLVIFTQTCQSVCSMKSSVRATHRSLSFLPKSKRFTPHHSRPIKFNSDLSRWTLLHVYTAAEYERKDIHIGKLVLTCLFLISSSVLPFHLFPCACCPSITFYPFLCMHLCRSNLSLVC